MKSENQKIMAAYNEAKARYDEEVARIRTEEETARAALTEHRRKVRELEELNRAVDRRRDELTHIVRRQAERRPLAALPPEPREPTTAFSEARYREVCLEVEAYHRQEGAYRKMVELAQKALEKTKTLQSQIAENEVEITDLLLLEDALKKLPEAELSRQMDYLAMPGGYRIEIDGRLQLFDARNCPFGLLSSGQAMRASYELCLKLNSLMKRAPGVVFIDNADLCDWIDELEPPQGIQLFTALVSKDSGLEIVSQ